MVVLRFYEMTTALCFRSSRAPRERYPWWKKKKTIIILLLPEDQDDDVSDFLRVTSLVIVLGEKNRVGGGRKEGFELRDSYCVCCIFFYFIHES